MESRRSGRSQNQAGIVRKKNGVVRPVETLERRLLLAVTPVSYKTPTETTITTTGATVIAASVGDINKDNIPDFVALGGASALGLAYAATPFTASSTGTFTPL